MDDESQIENQQDALAGNESARNASAAVPSTAIAPLGNHDHALMTTPLFGLAMALLAGIAVWGTLEATLPVFQLPDHLTQVGGNAPDAELNAQRTALKVTKERNAIFSLVVLGSTLALVLTAFELVHRRAGARIIWGGLVAEVIAGVIALGAAVVGIGIHDGLELQDHRVGKTIIVQGAMFAIFGLGIGLAIGIPTLRPRLVITCVAGCLIGGMLTALIFPVVASTLLPNSNIDFLVPESRVGRLLWVGLTTGLIGLTTTGLGKDKKKLHAATV